MVELSRSIGVTIDATRPMRATITPTTCHSVILLPPRFGRIVAHRLLAVAQACRCRIVHNAEYDEHGKHRIYQVEQFCLDALQLQREAEHRCDRLNKQQQRRDKRQPEGLAGKPDFPVYHFFSPPFILYSMVQTCPRVTGLSGFSPSVIPAAIAHCRARSASDSSGSWPDG